MGFLVSILNGEPDRDAGLFIEPCAMAFHFGEFNCSQVFFNLVACVLTGKTEVGII